MNAYCAISLCLLCGIMCSCHSRTELEQGSALLGGTATTAQSNMSTDDVLQAVSQLQQGMTFAKVARIIPLSISNAVMFTRHSSCYDVPLGRYVVQLQFESALGYGNPNGKTNVGDTILLAPPRLEEAASRQRQ